MRENMEQHFNTPAEVIDNNMKAGEGKAHLPLGKMILLGIMAGAFIALGELPAVLRRMLLTT